jgi:branched-subunit amino acid transport protein
MTDWEVYLTIALLALATAITRSGFWLVGHHVPIPPRVRAALRFAPACALAAIIIPDVLLVESHVQLSVHNHKLIAAVLATAFYLYKRDMLLTIVLGMLCYTALRLWS